MLLLQKDFSKYLIDFEVFAMPRFFDFDKIWTKTFKFFHRFSFLSLRGHYSFAEIAGSLVYIIIISLMKEIYVTKYKILMIFKLINSF